MGRKIWTVSQELQEIQWKIIGSHQDEPQESSRNSLIFDRLMK